MSQSIASERSGVSHEFRRTLRLKCVTFADNEMIETQPLGLLPEAQVQILGPR